MSRLLLLLALLFAAAPASAHETTRSYLTLARRGAEVDTRLRVAFRDIEVAVWMDEDLDGQITWGEAQRRLGAVDAYVEGRLRLDAGGPCPLRRTGASPSVRSDVAYLDLDLQATCPSADAPLAVDTGLFFEIDPDHRELLQAAVGTRNSTQMLSRAEPRTVISGDSSGAFTSFVAYLRAGAEHLLGGADHLIFLIVLMLPAVSAQRGPRRAAAAVLTAVTGFTLAHALTLTAATTDVLRPPTDLINLLIALSIVVTAADNMVPFIPAPRAGVAAFFGIIHGFGFATALGALDLGGRDLALALFGFNFGIEAAQIGIVAVAMPALYMIAGSGILLYVGSIGAVLVGLGWTWQRLAPLGLG